jgi:hypothetical protein
MTQFPEVNNNKDHGVRKHHTESSCCANLAQKVKVNIG